ncbi:DMT family transporter [Fulvivirgaceae bacterium BMA10]|uniref:DMT family transporter n=1 Tax=Splendidivirga corallicola TaxID=3051826 RepID=A0ABT8KIE0_9BACT|nr:DMT family transporter [Fulvivirgaceae bacterium BMA10]
MKSSFKDYLQLHFIVLIWGFTAILGKLVTVPAVELVFYRTLFASITLGFLLYYRKRNVALDLSELLRILGIGALIGLHWILFFAAARVSTVSVCLAGMATTTLWTSILEPIMTKKRIQLFEVLIGLVIILGLYVIFRFEFNHFLGLSMAVGAAFLAAMFSILNSQMTKRQSNPYIITFYEMIGAFLCTAIFLPLYLQFFSIDGQIHLEMNNMDVLYIVILATVCTVIPFSVSVELMKRISAYTVNLTINLEPIYGIILAVIIFKDKEKMSGGFYLGTLIILMSVLIYPLINRYYQRKVNIRDI